MVGRQLLGEYDVVLSRNTLSVTITVPLANAPGLNVTTTLLLPLAIVAVPAR
jgi:hypothetical protein